MSKKVLTPAEINRISLNYLQALKLAQGQKALDLTDLTWRKGWFYLRPPGLSRDAMAIIYRPNQIEAMTVALQKEILK